MMKAAVKGLSREMRANEHRARVARIGHDPAGDRGYSWVLDQLARIEGREARAGYYDRL